MLERLPPAKLRELYAEAIRREADFRRRAEEMDSPDKTYREGLELEKHSDDERREMLELEQRREDEFFRKMRAVETPAEDDLLRMKLIEKRDFLPSTYFDDPAPCPEISAEKT